MKKKCGRCQVDNSPNVCMICIRHHLDTKIPRYPIGSIVKCKFGLGLYGEITQATKKSNGVWLYWIKFPPAHNPYLYSHGMYLMEHQMDLVYES